MSDETTPAAESPAGPALRIVRGNPDDVDIAVLTAVLSAAGGAASAPDRPERNLWGSPEQRLRPSWAPAPTGFLNVHFSH